MSEMQKKLGVTSFILEMKHVENYPNFEKLAHIIKHGLWGCIVKNTERKSTEANNVSHILYKWVCCFRISSVAIPFVGLNLVIQQNEKLRKGNSMVPGTKKQRNI